MTSPTLTEQPASTVAASARSARILLPAVLFVVTLLSTTAVGMRYMHNFLAGQAPISSDADVLPYRWVLAHLNLFPSGLPFSLTLIAILLAHEFGHYFACRFFGVDASLPYLIPAPSISGTFGAIIRLKSRVQTRSALLLIGAAGPIAGFLVAACAVAAGLALSTYAALPVLHRIQAPVLMTLLQSAMDRGGVPHSLALIVPHPILVASWIGLLITALNLVPAGQLDGGHMVYALSPTAHKYSSFGVSVVLLLLGVFCWSPWILWGLILLLPGMRHPRVPEATPPRRWHVGVAALSALILLLSATPEPIHGFSLIDLARKLPHRYAQRLH